MGLAQRWKRPALPFEAKEALSAARGNTYPATNVVDINRARAKAAAPIVETSNIAELNQKSDVGWQQCESVGAAARMVTSMASYCPAQKSSLKSF